MYGGSQM
jgi:hypothetical protein